jgi:membrane glycosyltransferase
LKRLRGIVTDVVFWLSSPFWFLLILVFAGVAWAQGHKRQRDQ